MVSETDKNPNPNTALLFTVGVGGASSFKHLLYQMVIKSSVGEEHGSVGVLHFTIG